ncbi:MAG: hypothetical protein FWD38_00620 [Oscillospiraceae bacterium]|nr:hypothetical protein [Oscillospiraceae bacterium]
MLKEKKYLYLLLSVVITACLTVTACGNGQSGDDAESAAGSAANGSETETDNRPQEPTLFSFKMGETVINMDSDISLITGSLGQPLSVLEAPSCAFDGTDRIFSYPGIQIYTYPKENSDFIHTVGFFDDSVVTTEGRIRLGSDIQAVFDAYGENYRYETGMYTFTRGKTVLEFLTDDNIVIGITYRYILDL